MKRTMAPPASSPTLRPGAGSPRAAAPAGLAATRRRSLSRTTTGSSRPATSERTRSSFTIPSPAIHRPATRHTHPEIDNDTSAEGPDRGRRRGDRPGDGAAPRRGGLRRYLGVKRRPGPRPPALRTARRVRPRPDAPRPRRLEAHRDSPGRGNRHADRRRLRPWDRARPRARARDRGRRLPREAVLDEGARGPGLRRPRARGPLPAPAPRGAGRREEMPRGEPIEIAELRIDPREVQAYVDGEAVGLTP